MKRITVFILALTFAVGLLAWGRFVWPTPWKEYHVGSKMIRVNRITGETQVLRSFGWMPQ